MRAAARTTATTAATLAVAATAALAAAAPASAAGHAFGTKWAGSSCFLGSPGATVAVWYAADPELAHDAVELLGPDGRVLGSTPVSAASSYVLPVSGSGLAPGLRTVTYRMASEAARGRGLPVDVVVHRCDGWRSPADYNAEFGDVDPVPATAFRNAGGQALHATAWSGTLALSGGVGHFLAPRTAAAYAALGYEAGPLGRATSSTWQIPDPAPLYAADGGALGSYTLFERGRVYDLGEGRVHEVHGQIAQKFAALGHENGLLGLPSTGELRSASGKGRSQDFARRASVYWSAATGAHEVHGDIRDRYLALGADRSRLGFPVTDETAAPGVPGGRRSTFQGGTLTWTPGGGVSVAYR